MTWSDSRIQSTNPNLPWERMNENQTITVITRSGRSGTTAAFTEALTKCAGCDANLWKPGMSVDFGAPLLRTAKGNAGVVDAVASTPYSIGYASYASVEAAGEATARCLAWQLDGSNKIVTIARTLHDPQEFAWPVPLTSYILVANHAQSSCEERRWAGKFLADLYTLSEQANNLHFQVLPRPDILDEIPCTGDHSTRRLLSRRLAHSASDNEFKCKKTKPKCSDIQVVGYIDSGVPEPGLPQPSIKLDFSTKVTFGLMLAAVALLEHVANVKLYADRGGYSVSLAMDLVAVGVCNIVGAMFGSFVVAGGFSRSALNEGATSQLSMLMSVVISFLVVAAIAPLLSMLPDVVLSVILFCAVVPLIDVKTVVRLLRLGHYGRTDLLALTVAFFATSFLGVVTGMMTAIAFSMAVFVFNSVFPQISELHRSSGALHYSPHQEIVPESNSKQRLKRMATQVFEEQKIKTKSVKILRFEAPLWFANSGHLSDRMHAEFKSVALRGIVMDMSTVPWMDNTAAKVLTTVLADAQEKCIQVVFASCNDDVRTMLQKVCRIDDSQLVPSLYSAEMTVRAGNRPSISTAEELCSQPKAVDIDAVT